ncbi:hypothetical protein [Nodosilinea sp. P-1105]|uniref:hypothetical protein n=1 Tax=Nodosilinea sp. P-1105 TaxID=2546229 RepID=UPI00146E58F0|nr:hypothetical protein [Nodosilinea sp. P-1105]NMF83108.1 hypothetical protein [Nodosilinea sp. P-1105]
MDSASQPDTPGGEPPSKLSSLLGLAIAILTLTLPLFMVAHFSTVTGVTPDPVLFTTPTPDRR